MIIGEYGGVGKAVSEILSTSENIRLTAAGRDPAKAENKIKKSFEIYSEDNYPLWGVSSTRNCSRQCLHGATQSI